MSKKVFYPKLFLCLHRHFSLLLVCFSAQFVSRLLVFFAYVIGSKVKQYFGNWINNLDYLKEKFLNAKPFEHIVIDDFLNINYAPNIMLTKIKFIKNLTSIK